MYVRSGGVLVFCLFLALCLFIRVRVGWGGCISWVLFILCVYCLCWFCVWLARFVAVCACYGCLLDVLLGLLYCGVVLVVDCADCFVV